MPAAPPPDPRPRAHDRLTQKFNQLLLPSLSGLGAREGGEEGEGRKSRWVSQFSHLKKKKKLKSREGQKKKKLNIYYSRDNSTQHTRTHTRAHAHTRAPPKRGINPRNKCSRPAGEGRTGEGSGPVRETELRTLQPQAAAGAAARVPTARAALPPVAVRLPRPHRVPSLTPLRRRPPQPGLA